MEPERYAGYSDEGLVLQALWRCVNCGEVVDSVIVENRWQSRTAPVGAETASV
jgi:ABC-type ATPase with predicted acetyltransferase domain